MTNHKIYFILFLKGILIGAGAIVPGISGGTVAVLTNTFELIIESVANLFTRFKSSFLTLFPIVAGAVFSIILVSKPLNFFGAEFPLASKFTYLSISLFSTFLFARSCINFDFKASKLLAIIFGILLSFLISFMTTQTSLFISNENPLYLIFIGFPLAISLVLPGISFSYMLLFFGLYERTLSAINSFDLLYLILLFFSVAVGTVIFSKCLLKLIENHKQETYSFVLGFVVNSMIDMLLR